MSYKFSNPNSAKTITHHLHFWSITLGHGKGPAEWEYCVHYKHSN